MSDSDSIAYVEAKIAALLIKLNAATVELDRFYYRACLRGWDQTLARLKKKETTHA